VPAKPKNASLTSTFKIFPLIHVSVGVGLSYFTLCGFVYKTRIAVRAGALTVRHGPLPWLGARTVASRELKQLFSVQKI